MLPPEDGVSSSREIVLSEYVLLPAAAGRPRLFADGPTMFNALSNVVGYLNAEGYCNADKCHVSTRCNEDCPSCTVCWTPMMLVLQYGMEE